MTRQLILLGGGPAHLGEHTHVHDRILLYPQG